MLLVTQQKLMLLLELEEGLVNFRWGKNKLEPVLTPPPREGGGRFDAF